MAMPMVPGATFEKLTASVILQQAFAKPKPKRR